MEIKKISKKIGKIFGKGLIQGLGILSILGLAGYVYAAQVGTVTSGSTLTADMWNSMAGNYDYSTGEVNTGKKWIDGKPIYRKVIEGQFGASGVDTSSILIDTYLETLVSGIANTKQISGYIKSAGLGFQSTGTTHYYYIQTTTDGKSLYSLAYHSEWVNQNWVAIVEYTKSTDVGN